jgi:hypothetical protein
MFQDRKNSELNHDLGQEISNKAINTTLYYCSQEDGTKENLIHIDTIRFHMDSDFRQKT